MRDYSFSRKSGKVISRQLFTGPDGVKKMRPVWVFSIGFLSFCGMFALAQLPSIEAQGPGAVAESAIVLGEPTAKSLKDFRQAIIKTCEQSVRAGEMPRGELIWWRFRLATMSPKLLGQIHNAAAEQVLSDGLASSAGAIDWNALLAFIKEILPIILELIKLFSQQPA